jgi:2-succinyl-5-enolpyruvyl-6-hydroxy-3-cyclohexene-1-carboxylate synthase
MNGNDAVIAALFGELDALGVEEFCIAAGARNAPLIAALLARETQLRVWHFFEERSAAFFALGRVMMTRRPVAVLTTSGTAVGELLPAVMEAHYQALPLVLISADRPSHYRGSGAPQAVEQVGIFGDYAASEVELEATADGGVQMSDSLGARSGPIHFNICLDEGISAGSIENQQANTALSVPVSVPVEADRQNWREFWKAEGEILVVAAGLHPTDVPSAREFLLKLKAPVFAEATANLASDPALSHLLIQGGEKALADLPARRVLRLGAVPSGRWWRDLEERSDVCVLSISRAPFRGLARVEGVAVVPWEMLSRSDFCVANSRAAATAISPSSLLDEHPKSETAWVRAVSRLIPGRATVFLGNSLPIREWNLAAEAPKPGTVFFANRGANGIDGLISTWLGLAAGADESWLILGDLSAMYDLSAPWILPQLKAAKRRIVIINNGGGKIFSRVGWLRGLNDEARRMIENRHAIGFGPWAQMWGMDYRLITEPAKLCDDESPCAVWEIRPDEAQTEAFWAAWR